jgi:hypothetical protein
VHEGGDIDMIACPKAQQARCRMMAASRVGRGNEGRRINAVPSGSF